MESVPVNPGPRTEGDCDDTDYIYATQNNYTSYTLTFCTAGPVGDSGSGDKIITPGGTIGGPCHSHCASDCVVQGGGNCDSACDAGYELSYYHCVDIDECATNQDNCSQNAMCANNDGGFTCTCNSGYTGDGVNCVVNETNVNECLTNNGGCDVHALCTNNGNSHDCTCFPGYTGNGITCEDVNECLTNNGGCTNLQTCVNEPGSSSCVSLSQTGLIAWWMFDEGSGSQALDSIGNYHGTIYGSGWRENCKVGKCLHFDGKNDYVQIAQNIPTGAKTIIAWVYFDDISNNHQAIFGNHLAQLHANDKLSFKDSGNGYVFSSGSIEEREWTHVAYVFDYDSGKIKFYINGQASGEASISYFNIVTNVIGILQPGSGNSVNPIDGMLDDIRLYSRALSGNEVEALYNATR